MAERVGPQPWPGCDTGGAAWKAYCEAWEHCFTRKDASLRAMIADRRGRQALDDLDHNMRVVKGDYSGAYADDRTQIAKLLR